MQQLPGVLIGPVHLGRVHPNIQHRMPTVPRRELLPGPNHQHANPLHQRHQLLSRERHRPYAVRDVRCGPAGGHRVLHDGQHGVRVLCGGVDLFLDLKCGDVFSV